jgi:hypothetical protein
MTAEAIEVPTDPMVAMRGTPGQRRAFIKRRRKQAATDPADRERRALAASLSAEPALRVDEALGYRRFESGELTGADELVVAAQAVIDRYPDGVPFTNKPQLATGLVQHDDLALDGPMMRFALRPDVVAAVSRYLGVVPVLGTVDVWQSRHVEGAPVSSQVYHCDGADIRQLKLLVNCSDVTPASGPFTFFDAATSARLIKRLGVRAKISDDTVREHVGDREPTALAGPPGTAAFIDSSRCLHMGSRVQAAAPPRTVLLIQYLTPYAFIFGDDHRETAEHRVRPSDTTSRLERLLLGAQ